jgi:hypothetical protein
MKHKMSLILFCTLIVLMIGGNQAAGVSAGNSAFTYEGYLAEDGNPADGIYDFQFTLYGASNGGNQIGNVITLEDIAVDNGLFSVSLDFGAGAFTGEPRWLEVGARPGNSTGQYTPHLPLHALGSAPWSEFPGAGRSAHDHLGQTWTGSDPLVINGTYENAPLILSNDSGYGLQVISAGTNGIRVNSAGTNGFRVNSAGATGLRVGNAGVHGVAVDYAGAYGLLVSDAGENGLLVENAGFHGVEVQTTGEDGLLVRSAGTNGLLVENAGLHGVEVQTTGTDGFWVGSAGGEGLYVGSAGDNGVYVVNAGNTGVVVDSAAQGLTVGSAGFHGVEVVSAGNVGFLVGSAGDHGLYVIDAGVHGVAVDSAGNIGFQVGSAGDYGFQVESAGNNGVNVVNAGNNGVAVDYAGNNGLRVSNAGNNGVQIDSAGGYAGWFGGSIYARDGCVGCTITMFGINSGDVPLQPGDIVSIQGLLPSNFAEAATLMQVKAASRGETVIGVVQGRAEVSRGTDSQQGNSQDRLVPRQGMVDPGDYVTIIIYGPAQVKASALSGPISAGTRLTLGDDGGVRTLITTEVNGVQIAESASTIGIALEEPGDNELIWVLVSPQ